MKTYLYFDAYIAQDIALTLFFSRQIQCSKIPVKILFRPSQILPKSCPNPPQIDPRQHQEAFWGLCWTPYRTKLNFEHQKSSQESPKSPQERLKSTENWRQIRFFSYVFLDAVFEAILKCFLEAPNLEFAAPVEAKRYFLQNWHYPKTLKKSWILEQFLGRKTMKNQ